MDGNQNSIRVLVVEDDVLVQRVLKLQLEARNYDVISCDDGLEGLAAIEATLPDVIVLDLMLPKMDGFQVLERVKSIEKLADIPVLILTASLDDAYRRKSLAHRADAYLTKPYDERVLHETIQSLLQFA